LKIDPAPVRSRPHPQYYGRPPLLDTILLPDQAQLPGASTSTGTRPTSSLP